jgi:hypothetical protein
LSLPLTSLFVGVFPPGSLGQLIYEYGFCSSGFLNDALYKKCMNQELTLEEIDLDFMNNNPAVPYNFLQSKTDAVQISFYISVAQTTNATKKTITPSEFYVAVNEIFGDYNDARKNFVTYLVNGDQHCFTPYDLYYTADTISAKDNGASTSTQLMSNWVNSLPLSTNEAINTRCDGTIQSSSSSSPYSSRFRSDFTSGSDNTYCSSKVVPKQFTEPK